MATVDEQQNAAILQLQQAFTQANARLDQLASAVQSGGDRIAATEQRFAAGEQRITGMEKTVSDAVTAFTPVAGRVTELSSAAVAFNERLNAVEQAIVDLVARAPAPTEERFAEIEASLARLDGRLDGVEAQRARGGRLAQRLASIEARLPEAPTEEPTPEGEPL